MNTPNKDPYTSNLRPHTQVAKASYTPGLLVKQVKYLMWQVMDTPGLLPRGDAARNEMELLTLASMQVLYLLY